MDTPLITLPLTFFLESRWEDLPSIQHATKEATITLTLKEFVGTLLGTKEFVILTLQEGETILKQCPPPWKEFHLKLDIERGVSTLWEIAAWKASYARHCNTKRDSERNRQEGFRKTALIETLARAMSGKIGIDVETAKPLAYAIITGQQDQVANSFGIMDIRWKLTEEEIDNIMKE